MPSQQIATTNTTNAIDIRVGREFVAGDRITGRVILTICDPQVNAYGLYLHVQGKEFIKFGHDKDGRHRGTRVLNKKLALESESSFSAGTYTYTFEYTLPENLAESFVLGGGTARSKRRGDQFSIVYKLKAVLATKGILAPNVQTEMPIAVHQIPPSETQPQASEMTKQVRSLFGWKQGVCELDAITDKSFYMPGETVNLHYRVHNNSRRELASLTCGIYQVVRGTIRKEPIETEWAVYEADLGSIFPLSEIEQTQHLPLKSRLFCELLPATSTGKRVQVTYEVIVEVENLCVYVPIVVVAPSAVHLVGPVEGE